jgi:tripartite-type tricarboxylate transporter receptor subunit TctC
MATGLLGLAALPARASGAWPAKPINLVVPFPPGGPTDTQLRALATALGKDLGQPVVVMNQPGAGGTLAPSQMARSAAADGYTLAMITPAVFRLPHLQKVNYDVLHDFTYVAGLTSYVYAMSVPMDSRFKSLAEAVAFAKANPGQLSVAVVGSGTLGHIATHRLQKLAGIQLNHVPFKGGADAVTALLGGHVDVMLEAGWGAMANGGKLRLLAVAEEQRLPKWPQVPTFKEAGYDIVVRSTIGLAGPRNLPEPIVARLEQALKKATQDAAYARALDTESMPNRFEGSQAYRQYALAQYASDRLSMRELGLAME